MARIRSIHPGLFSDPEFADLSSDAQVFYLGLLTEADDSGVFEWKPTTLRIRLRPTKDGPVDALLSELVAADKVRPYEIDGRQYGAIRKFTTWQRPKSPKSWHPIPKHFRNYIGSSGEISPIGGNEPTSTPPPSEKPPQRKEEGGRRKDGSSEANASGEAAEPDMLKAAFDAGIKVLGKAGHSEQQARGLIGKWRKDYGEGAVLEALGKCQLSGASEPVSFVTACLKAGTKSTGAPRKPGAVDWN